MFFWKEEKREGKNFLQDRKRKPRCPPEVHIGEAHEKEPEPEPEENITYENVAIPEIHIHRKKK